MREYDQKYSKLARTVEKYTETEFPDYHEEEVETALRTGFFLLQNMEKAKNSDSEEEWIEIADVYLEKYEVSSRDNTSSLAGP